MFLMFFVGGGGGGGGQFLQGITICLVSTLMCTVLQPSNFRAEGRDQVLVFFNRHSTTMILMEDKQQGLLTHGYSMSKYLG